MVTGSHRVVDNGIGADEADFDLGIIFFFFLSLRSCFERGYRFRSFVGLVRSRLRLSRRRVVGVRMASSSSAAASSSSSSSSSAAAATALTINFPASSTASSPTSSSLAVAAWSGRSLWIRSWAAVSRRNCPARGRHRTLCFRLGGICRGRRFCV